MVASQPVTHLTHTKTRARTVTLPRDRERVRAHEAGLELVDLAAGAARACGERVDRADSDAAARRTSRSVVASKTVGPVEDPVVELVEVELVLEHRRTARACGTGLVRAE